MTLLNGILALGALAFTIPLAIHLLFRSRFRTLDWGAMHLLDSVVRINRRRIQLLHLLLLLLRCALPILLAFCLARPVLTGFRSLPGDEPQSLIIAIDDSRSMSARDESGLTRMDHAKRGLTELLQDLSRRDEVILVRSSRLGAPASAQAAQDAVSRVRELNADQGPVDLGAVVRGAIEAADQASHPQRRILVVGDFPSHAVEDASMASLSGVANTLNEASIRPVISFWNLGEDSQRLENVSVDSVEIDSPAVVAGREASFSARIRNASDIPLRDLRVHWSLDGRELSPTTVTIPPRSTVTSRLSQSLDEVGVHQLTVAVEHADALIDDNRRSIGVEVIREIRVTLVDGQPSRYALESETDFLALALSPFAFGGDDQPDAVRTNIIRPGQIRNELDEQSPDILVLANVAKVEPDVRKAISQFVMSGGALMLFDGDGIDIDSYNEPWFDNSTSEQSSRPSSVGVNAEQSVPSNQSAMSSLPARLGPFIGAAAAKDSEALPIAGRNPIYSPWNVLGESDLQAFADVQIYGYRQLFVGTSSGNDNPITSGRPVDVATGGPLSQLDDAAQGNAAAPSDAAITLWSMSNGDPLVIYAKRGRGRVVQFAIPADIAWSSLPLRMVYLPMMQQMVLDLAGSRNETTIPVGNGFSVAVAELEAGIPEGAKIDDSQNVNFVLEPPDGAELELQPNDESPPRLAVPRTSVPGPYRLRKSTPLQGEQAIWTSTMRIAEVPSVESQLRDADPARLAAAAKLVDANIYTDLESMQSDDRTRRFGREIWRWLLVALLVVLVAELWLQQRSVKAIRLGAS